MDGYKCGPGKSRTGTTAQKPTQAPRLPTPRQIKASVDPFAFYQAEIQHAPTLKANAKGWSQNFQCPFHEDSNGSFAVSAKIGSYHCFGCDHKGGSVIDFAMDYDKLSLDEARAKFADQYLVAPGAPTPRSTRKPKTPDPTPKVSPGPLVPIPAEALATRPQRLSGLGNPSATWTYRDADGRPVAFVCRFERPDGGKEFRPQTWTPAGGRQWKAPPELRPLYNLDLLRALPDADALICEGEKASDAAAVLVSDSIACTTMNGAQSPQKSDFGPLIGRRVLIWPDADKPGAEYAHKVAELALAAGAASVEVLELASLALDPKTGEPRDLPAGWDVADAAADGWTAEALAAAARWTVIPGHDTDAPPPPEDGDPGPTDDTSSSTDAATITRLAGMSPLAYDRVREAEAAALGIRVATLDKEVLKARGTTQTDSNDMAVVENLDPWPDPVSGLELAEAIRDDFRRFVVADQEALDTLTVWTLGTYVYDVFQVWAKAFVSSPERRCGKSTTLTVIEANVSRALMASSITASALFRAVDLWRPSLILDEADRLPKDNEDLTAVINAGHMRRTAVIIRNVPVGDSYEPRKFSVWAPMVLAAIGRLADTIMDRSIVIPMRRKLPHETSDKVPADLFELRLDRRRQCLRWALDATPALVAARVSLPMHGNDRALDNWTPLYAIAKTIGGDWPGRIGHAFARLAVADGDHEDAAGPMLLQDIRSVFEDKQTPKLWSADLVAALVEMEDRPWCEWKRGKPITQNSLARILKPYKVRPTDLRIGANKSKGYHFEDFRDAFARYLTPTTTEHPPKPTETPRHPSNCAGSGDFTTETTNTGVSDANDRKRSNREGCLGVSVENQGPGGEEAVAPGTGDVGRVEL